MVSYGLGRPARRVPLEPSGVVLFRVYPATSVELGPLVRAFLASKGPWNGHISIITTGGIQMLAARKA